MKKSLIVLLALVAGCAGGPRILQKPKVSVIGLRFTGISLETVDFQVDLAVDNPNGFSLGGPEIDFRILADGDPLADGKVAVSGTIGADRRTTVNLPLRINFIDAIEKVIKLKGCDEFGFAVDGGLSFDVGALGRLRFPFQQMGKIAVPKPVGVKIAHLRKEKGGNPLSLTARMTIEVKNKNIFALGNPGGRLRLTLDGTEVGEFDTVFTQPIPAHGEGNATFLMELKVVKLITRLASGCKARLVGAFGVETTWGRLKIPVDIEEDLSLR